MHPALGHIAPHHGHTLRSPSMRGHVRRDVRRRVGPNGSGLTFIGRFRNLPKVNEQLPVEALITGTNVSLPVRTRSAIYG